MKENEIEPRTLADDLVFSSSGKNHKEKTIKGIEIFLFLFYNIGAKVDEKHMLHDLHVRENKKNVRKTLFGDEGALMQVVNQFRDLGGHVCMDMTKSAVTLNQRRKEL